MRAILQQFVRRGSLLCGASKVDYVVIGVGFSVMITVRISLCLGAGVGRVLEGYLWSDWGIFLSLLW